MIDYETVRILALSLPEAEEHDHFGCPSFRVRNKIFATLWQAEERVVLKLALADQTALVSFDPQVFAPVPGAWGNQGWTNVFLQHVGPKVFGQALQSAWRQVAPKRLIATLTSSVRD